jgi:hypothetical protein
LRRIPSRLRPCDGRQGQGHADGESGRSDALHLIDAYLASLPQAQQFDTSNRFHIRKMPLL